jgi:glyoxylase-like metal-dependent hydrolase (beta-lactamase superfamily II)
MLVQVDDRTILVDTGVGVRWSEAERARFGIDHREHELVRSLAARGLGRDDVTDVVLTHLHFDHAGGTTRPRPDGRLELSFPRARHHLQRRNLAHARAPSSRDRASYLSESFEALLARPELLVLHDGPAELAAGVDTIVFEGHTPAQQLVRVRDPKPGGRWLLYAADLVPTLSHAAPAWVMAYDLEPAVAALEKARVLERAEREGGWLFLEHDPKSAFAEIRRAARGKLELVSPDD